MKIYVLKLECSNFYSVIAFFRILSSQVHEISLDKLSHIEESSILVIPGVGHIESFFDEVNRVLPTSSLRELIFSRKLMVIGICLGFQVLCRFSAEKQDIHCLNLFPYQIQKIHQDARPLVGWKESFASSTRISEYSKLEELLDNKFFYHTHSYGLLETPTKSSYCYAGLRLKDGRQVFTALIKDNFAGFQFHPEKSGAAGLRLMESVIDYFNCHRSKLLI